MSKSRQLERETPPNRGEGQSSGAYEEQRATALALENIRTSSQDLRDTCERQAQENARLRDENERLRNELYELRQGQSGEINRAETFRFLREMFSQTDDRQTTTTTTTTAATGDAAAKLPDLLPKEGTCPNG
jgi:regulator of replication initiation timing